jgi:hypothetical protein
MSTAEPMVTSESWYLSVFHTRPRRVVADEDACLHGLPPADSMAVHGEPTILTITLVASDFPVHRRSHRAGLLMEA